MGGILVLDAHKRQAIKVAENLLTTTAEVAVSSTMKPLILPPSLLLLRSSTCCSREDISIQVYKFQSMRTAAHEGNSASIRSLARTILLCR